MRHVLLITLLASACTPSAPIENSTTESIEDNIAWYTCPMHPSIHQSNPGSCPICGMTLTPVKQTEIVTGTTNIDAQRRNQFGIELEKATIRHLNTQIQIPAVVGWNTNTLTDITVRTTGWIKHITHAPGEPIRAGEVLFTLFSPELVTAQDDLLRAATQAQNGDPTASARRDATRLRLSRLGLTNMEIDTIISKGQTIEDIPIHATHTGIIIERTVVEGAMVNPGQTLYRLADPSTVWIEGALTEDQIGQVTPGQTVSIMAPGFTTPLEGTIAHLLPQIDPNTRTARIRVNAQNPEGKLRPDQWTTLTITTKSGDYLTISESAVLYTGPRRIVFVDIGNDQLVPREVSTGIKSEGYIEIREGLSANDQVVRSGNFLVAADSRLKKGGP